MNKKKLLFVYDIKDEALWKDGLWAAIELLKKDFDVEKWNIAQSAPDKDLTNTDFALGWGGFSSPVARVLKDLPFKKGLCLGGYAPLMEQAQYDVIFYETEWSRQWLEKFCDSEMVHAFGVNTSIYKPIEVPKLWDWLTVGAFASWKRQTRITAKNGSKMAIGEVQKENLGESVDILGDLILGHCGVSDAISPEKLALMYNLSKTVYIPADTMGGGERAVLEARACGVPVEVESDNLKLMELLESPVWDHKYYAEQLKKGINKCLKEN